MYDRLAADATHIIHNAWTVNLKLSALTLLSANIPRVQALIQFASATAHSALLFLISSIGTVMNLRKYGRQGLVPEVIIADSAVAQEIGYSQTKYVAEQLLDIAFTKSGIDVCCFRVGQTSGPVGTDMGAWNKTTENVEEDPAVKLLEFFVSLQRLDNKIDEPIISAQKAKRHCPTLRTCGRVTEEWVELWMRQ
ncbi:hypothetical protein FOVG_13955 [Fusarium oxysporum f. sp. pisi HDV247]|uniref:Thioester reductase (TE) domain-containing protein n=1 Tax=Fusarium oxysporum f. sp. pisi HDV247 TaxID=1080344 RepID=W9NQU2_FUSOX|nr:hypothetical protein FOVG_13955 [Fusarium oxysporum f. sp. pisi HDV247]